MSRITSKQDRPSRLAGQVARLRHSSLTGIIASASGAVSGLLQVLPWNPERHSAGDGDDIVLPDSADQLVRGPRLELVIAREPADHVGGRHLKATV